MNSFSKPFPRFVSLDRLNANLTTLWKRIGEFPEKKSKDWCCSQKHLSPESFLWTRGIQYRQHCKKFTAKIQLAHRVDAFPEISFPICSSENVECTFDRTDFIHWSSEKVPHKPEKKWFFSPIISAKSCSWPVECSFNSYIKNISIECRYFFIQYSQKIL